MSEMVYLNGRIVPAEQAKISVFDAGLTHSAGLFETMRAYHGRVMRFAAHIDRLTRSAAVLDMNMDVQAEVLHQAVLDVLKANHLRDARIRLILTPGSVRRLDQSRQNCDREDTATSCRQPTVWITAGEVKTYPPELYASGMRVCICPYKQNRQDPTAGHKTLGYLPRLLAMKHAAQRRCQEALWFNTENQLAEGSVCNVFTVQDDVLVTPPLATPVLPGIVRKTVLELAGTADIRWQERPIDIDALLAASEVFLTGSVMEIMPVTSIEKHMVGEGTVGEMTRRLQSLYADLVARECAPDD